MKNSVTLFRRTLLLLALAICWQNGFGQFTPGEGGALPAAPVFTSIPGKISGLYVQSSEREKATPSGTRAVVHLGFYKPSAFGATSYTLQYSTNNGTTWANYKVGGVDVTTTDSTLSVNLAGNYSLRLFVNGGSSNGYTSNVAQVTLSSIDTRFTVLQLDDSTYYSGITSPYVGFELGGNVSVQKLIDNSPVTGFISYQWYRVNPATFETTIISGAATVSYTTTQADAGYLLLLKVSGDGVNVGGFAQILVPYRILIPNKSFASNSSNSGFTLNLFQTIAGLTSNDFMLSDSKETPITINSVSQGANAAIYNIAASMGGANSPYYMINRFSYWGIVSSLFLGITVNGVFIDVATGIDETPESKFLVFPIPIVNAVNFKAGVPIQLAEIVSVNGAVLEQAVINSMAGTLNVSHLSPGIYFLRLKTSDGVMIRKIEIKK